MTGMEKKLAFLLATSPHLDTLSGSYDEAARDLVANGVVPVVRCKDCKHSGMYAFGCGDAELACLDVEEDGFIRMASSVDPNGFCSFGERRDDDEREA